MDIDFNSGMPRFGAVFPPGMEATPSVDDVMERIAAAGADVARAEADGLFVPLPTRRPERSNDRSRVKTVRNRLFLMGYLGSDTGRGNLDPGLENAVRAFQVEAGLEADGWVGEAETWPALQELVSFETPIRLERWYRGETPTPALRRAAALRLAVFGLLPRPSDPASADIDEGLAAFRRVWRTLFGPATGAAESGRVWVARLFDMDGISRRLSAVPGDPGREAMKACHGFVLNAARIELWLMGYPVRPGGYDFELSGPPSGAGGSGLGAGDAWLKSRSVTRYLEIRRNFRFYKALHRFWRDHGEGDASADDRSVGFLGRFQEFFGLVAQGLRENAGLDDGARRRDLEDFLRERRAQLPVVWQRVRTFGARIWDGVRRVWGWFRRMTARVAGKVLEMGTNMARLIYDFALGSFQAVSNVMRGLGAAVRWAVSPELPGSDPARVVFRRDLDGDVRVVVDRGATPEGVAESRRRLARFARLFAFGCRVAGTLAVLLADAFRAGWKGYFGLVLALIRIRKVSGRLRELAAAYRETFAPEGA